MKRMTRYASLFLIIGCFMPLLAQKRAITFEDMWAMGRVSNETISPNGQWIAYTVSRYDVDANKGNSDIHLIAIDGTRHRQLTFHPKTDTSPQWSSDGNSLAFISTRDGSAQVYKIAINGGEAVQITDIPTGVDGFLWSPDNKQFIIETEMYPEADSPAASAEIATAAENDLATGRVIDGLLFRHWNAWKEGKMKCLLVCDADGNNAIRVSPADQDTPPISLGSSHDYAWSPDGRRICFVSNADDMVAASTNNDLWIYKYTSNSTRRFSGNAGNDMGPRFSPDGKFIAFMSMARAGFEADQTDLIVQPLDGNGPTRNLTLQLDRYVSDFSWSPDGNKLYFYVPHHARHRVYEVSVDDPSPKLLLDKRHISGLSITPDGKSLLLRIQAANMPAELFDFNLKKKRLTQITRTNQSLLAELDMPSIEDHWFTGANGDSVHLLLLKPPGFDAGKKYPLVNLIHGGPQGAFSDNFHYRWNSEMFASPGYVVIMINFHGSRGYGQEFCDAVSRNWGGAPFEDIITGTKWAVKQFDFIDGDRIGAAGASYGGFMINWIEGHNDDMLFKTLVSHDGVYEQVSMFGATEELWFPLWEFNGPPWEKGSLYQKWNPANFADNFKTPMLVIHGEHDYRVPYTQGLQLFSALQMKGVDSRLLFFPDEDHFVRKPQNARLWWETVHDWLGRYLKP